MISCQCILYRVYLNQESYSYNFNWSSQLYRSLKFGVSWLLCHCSMAHGPGAGIGGSVVGPRAENLFPPAKVFARLRFSNPAICGSDGRSLLIE